MVHPPEYPTIEICITVILQMGNLSMEDCLFQIIIIFFFKENRILVSLVEIKNPTARGLHKGACLFQNIREKGCCPLETEEKEWVRK